MVSLKAESSARRRPVNLSIREDIISDAKTLSLNASQAAEAGIAAAVKQAREEAWLRDNAAAIEAYNEMIAREGVAFLPDWLEDEA